MNVLLEYFDFSNFIAEEISFSFLALPVFLLPMHFEDVTTPVYADSKFLEEHPKCSLNLPLINRNTVELCTCRTFVVVVAVTFVAFLRY